MEKKSLKAEQMFKIHSAGIAQTDLTIKEPLLLWQNFAERRELLNLISVEDKRKKVLISEMLWPFWRLCVQLYRLQHSFWAWKQKKKANKDAKKLI